MIQHSTSDFKSDGEQAASHNADFASSLSEFSPSGGIGFFFIVVDD
jgi:hypothetical protein